MREVVMGVLTVLVMGTAASAAVAAAAPRQVTAPPPRVLAAPLPTPSLKIDDIMTQLSPSGLSVTETLECGDSFLLQVHSEHVTVVCSGVPGGNVAFHIARLSIPPNDVRAAVAAQSMADSIRTAQTHSGRIHLTVSKGAPVDGIRNLLWVTLID